MPTGMPAASYVVPQGRRKRLFLTASLEPSSMQQQLQQHLPLIYSPSCNGGRGTEGSGHSDTGTEPLYTYVTCRERVFQSQLMSSYQPTIPAPNIRDTYTQSTVHTHAATFCLLTAITTHGGADLPNASTARTITQGRRTTAHGVSQTITTFTIAHMHCNTSRYRERH